MTDAWLNEDHALLRESAQRYVERAYGFEQRRELVKSEAGYGEDHWKRFAEFGWLGVMVPEAYGGLGGSLLDVAVLMEVFGEGLVVEPYLSTVVLGAGTLARAGSGDLCAALLPGVVSGDRILAFAHGEPHSRYDLTNVQTRAVPDGEGFRVSGRKSVVLGGAAADQLVVSVRTAGGPLDAAGISLAVVDRDAKGVSVRGYPTVDGLRAADIDLDNVHVAPERMLGEKDGAAGTIEHAVRDGIVAVCAEAAGIMDVLVKSTRDYLKSREQFGGPISRFQVLQHHVVDMFVAHALARSLTFRVASDAARGGAPLESASAAKVQTDRSGRLVGQQAIQLHGGMGMTDDVAAGHYFKRLTMIGKTFGDVAFHLRRLAH